MDIQKDVKATGHQIPAFIAGTEMGELYDAMRVRWGGVNPSVMRLMQACSTAWA